MEHLADSVLINSNTKICQLLCIKSTVQRTIIDFPNHRRALIFYSDQFVLSADQIMFLLDYLIEFSFNLNQDSPRNKYQFWLTMFIRNKSSTLFKLS